MYGKSILFFIFCERKIKTQTEFLYTKFHKVYKFLHTSTFVILYVNYILLKFIFFKKIKTIATINLFKEIPFAGNCNPLPIDFKSGFIHNLNGALKSAMS